MKPVKKILVAILMAGSILSVAGCSSGVVYSSTSTYANWNVATSATVEKNCMDFWRNHKEVTSYSIDFAEGNNSVYKVEYYTSDPLPVYTTTFYMDKEDYDWGLDTLPKGIRIQSTDTAAPKDPVYVFETKFSINGRYVFIQTGEYVEFSDSVVTECTYRLAGEGLKPVKSVQTIKSTSPNTLSPSHKNNMCVDVDVVCETYYNRDCTKAVVTVDDKTEANEDSKKTVSLSGLVFDNAQLPFALRSFNLSGNKTFNVCSPQNGNYQSMTAVCASAVALNSEDEGDQKIINVLKNVKDGNGNPVKDYIFFDGTSFDHETPEKQIRCNNVKLSVNADMNGSSHVYSYATVENSNLNTTRAVLLKRTTPLSFGLGILTYTINSLSIVSF